MLLVLTARRRLGSPGLIALAALAFLAVSTGALALLGARPAAAHTELLQSSPGPGQRVGGNLEFVDLVFTEPVSDAVIEIEREGVPVSGSMVQTDGLIIRFEFDEALSSPGRYDLTYRMTSFDLDQTEESFFFTYEPSAPEALRLGNVEDADDGRNWVRIIATAVLIVCLAGLAFLLLARVEAKRRPGAAVGPDDLDGDG